MTESRQAEGTGASPDQEDPVLDTRFCKRVHKGVAFAGMCLGAVVLFSSARWWQIGLMAVTLYAVAYCSWIIFDKEPNKSDVVVKAWLWLRAKIPDKWMAMPTLELTLAVVVGCFLSVKSAGFLGVILSSFSLVVCIGLQLERQSANTDPERGPTCLSFICGLCFMIIFQGFIWGSSLERWIEECHDAIEEVVDPEAARKRRVMDAVKQLDPMLWSDAFRLLNSK